MKGLLTVEVILVDGDDLHYLNTDWRDWFVCLQIENLCFQISFGFGVMYLLLTWL